LDKRIKNPKIKTILDRLEQNKGIITVTDGELVRIFGKQPMIRKLRKNGRIFIGKDHKKNVTLIYRK